MKFEIVDNKTHGLQIMKVEPKENESVRLDFNHYKRDNKFIPLRMQISYSESDKLFYALMYGRDEDGLFRDLKLQVSFEELDLNRDVETKLGLIHKDES